MNRGWSGAVGLLAALGASVAGLAAAGFDRAVAADAGLRPGGAPALFDWSGFYVGTHVSYARGGVAQTLFDPAASTLRGTFGSVFGGLQAGYNMLLPSRMLIGIEADVSFPNHLVQNDTVATRVSGSGSEITEKLDAIGTLRARIGRAFGPFMPYATAGFAWSRMHVLETPGVASDEDKVSRTRVGWAAGFGSEFAIAPLWSMRIEYLYHHLGRAAAQLPSGVGIDSRLDVHALRLGINRQLSDVGAGFQANSRAAEFPDWNLHGQFTFIGQGYPSFRSPYEGANSLSGAAQFKNTISATAFIGARLWQGGEIYFNPEFMQGFGLNDVHGVGGFPNGEAQKSSFPIPRFNMARMFVRQTFDLGGEQEMIEDGPNQLAGKQDISRITVSFGKFAVLDFFNGNAFANDPRTTFLNWNAYGGGSYDWTMDRLSWTWGTVAELNQKSWAFRVGYFLMPTESNADNFDMHLVERGQYAAELELRYAVREMPGKLRLFGWLNRGNMGSYSEALALPLASPNYPDIALTRRVRVNYGVVLNLEQAITDDLGLFSRASWNAGRTEKIGWTDCDDSISLGAVLRGTGWGRPQDKIGVVGISEGLSSEARAYFAAGGLGILIGDGMLNYRREMIVEAYYALSLSKSTTLTFDYQFIANPGYNADRGPVSVFAARLHAEF